MSLADMTRFQLHDNVQNVCVIGGQDGEEAGGEGDDPVNP
jgi:hypothetical protein